MLSLIDRKWKEFYLKDILGISISSKAIHSNQIEKSKEYPIPYITRTNFNNGLFTIGENKHYKTNPKNSISLGAENAQYFYQPYEYITGNKMYYYYNANLNKSTLLFIVMCLNNAIKDCGFGYGLGLTGTRSDKRKIMLPVDNNDNPDYKFMESFTIEQEKIKKQEYLSYIQQKLKKLTLNKIIPLNKKEWKDFFISDICYILPGIDIYEKERINGNIPYITSTSLNNGIKYLISNVNKTLESNAISVNRNGSIGYSFYHKYKALYSNDCRKLKLKTNQNEFVSLFITNQISSQKEKYNYGYKMGTGRLQRQKIMLPINEKEEPDYIYMEQYIQNIMYKNLNLYLK